jgi:O-antigen/teichoic acid export membrane protein
MDHATTTAASTAAPSSAALNRRHLSHIALNIGSVVLPMAVGIAVVPGLIARLGSDRFGALALAWALVGYFGWLDLGLGRALTQYLSQQEAAGMARLQQAAMARKARNAMGLVALAWVVILLCCTPLVAGTVDMPADLRREIPVAWTLLVLAVPLMMWSACSVGVLEARSRFGAINGIRVPTGVLTFCVPWLIALDTNDLRVVMCGLLAVRLIATLAYAGLTRMEFDAGAAAPVGQLRILLRFGSWLSVTNLVSPFLSYFDRFAIAALVSMAAVAQYTIPFDALSRLPMAPIAMMGVLFPLLAHAHGLADGAAAQRSALLASAVRLLLAFWLPALALMVLLGPWLLHWWIGAEIAQASLPVWNWLAVGVVANGFAHIPFTLLQSAGRTDLIAKIHVCELAPYCLGLWWALVQWGIVGAAVVWTLRVLVDAGLLYACAARLFPANRGLLLKAGCWAFSGSMALVPVGLWMAQNAIHLQGVPPVSAMLACAAVLLAWCAYHVSQLRRSPRQPVLEAPAQ